MWVKVTTVFELEGDELKGCRLFEKLNWSIYELGSI
jgi:hypothetical protein